MKQTVHRLFVFSCFLFLSFVSEAQQPQTVIDFFLALPDPVFTTIHELNFAEKDSFPLRERTLMVSNFDTRKMSFAKSDPRFHIIFENETNRLLSCTNNDLNMDLKVWSLTDGRSLIAVSGSYKEDWKNQTVKFYYFEKGKVSGAQPLNDLVPIKMFFDSTYCKRQDVDPNYIIPHPLVEFSKTGDELQIKVQPEIFDEEIVGKKGEPLTRLNLVRIQRPWLLLTLQNDKFVITK